MPISAIPVYITGTKVKIIKSVSTKFIKLQAVIDSDDMEAGMPYMTITKHSTSWEQLEENEVCIKDYAENQGVLADLINQEVILPPHRTVNSGFIILHVCNLHPEFPWQ
jgi:hypothetical protein